jgi:hypothetical protein
MRNKVRIHVNIIGKCGVKVKVNVKKVKVNVKYSQGNEVNEELNRRRIE